MLTPFPTQLSAAHFLASRQHALLADEPRVGKTGAAIIAADYIFARRILVVTTASGRGVWKRGFADWSIFSVPVFVLHDTGRIPADADRVVVAWGSITSASVRAQLLNREWDLVISDEDHYAKSFESKRCQAFYGVPFDDGAVLAQGQSIASRAAALWRLTGSPIPNSPLDLYPALRSLHAERLRADEAHGWPDVTTQEAFTERYCVTRPMKLGRWRTRRVVVSGKDRNMDELRARLDGLMLRRTQADVGIGRPIYETLPFAVTDRMLAMERDVDRKAMLDAAKRGDTRSLDAGLSELRRRTGEIMAELVIDHVRDEMAGGLDKVVLMAWHRETMRLLREGLAEFGVVGIDGSTPADKRDAITAQFRDDPETRVFVGQIVACGEAIDLSAAAVLLFVESSFVPKDMLQASLRITNYTQTRQAFVRVCVLLGSIGEAIETILIRKWSTIRKVLN